jgi:hypothetical protein
LTKKEYDAYLKRTNQIEPSHLTTPGTHNKKRQDWDETKREEQEKQRGGVSELLDRLADHIYRRHNVCDLLREMVFVCTYHRGFSVFPTGVSPYLKKMIRRYLRLKEWPTKHIGDEWGVKRLGNILDIWWRISYSPEIRDADSRTKTIHDFAGQDDRGRPERFSAFLRKVVDNGYISLRRKQHRDQTISVHLENTATGRAQYGGISEDLVTVAAGEEDVLHSSFLPRPLSQWLYAVELEHRAAHPEIFHALLDLDIKSAVEIERRVKSGALSDLGRFDGVGRAYVSTHPSPRDRRQIKGILDAFRADYLECTRQFVRREQKAALKGGGLTPECAPNLDDPEVLDREVKRVMGWNAKAAKDNEHYAGGHLKELKRTHEQQLGWETYSVGNPVDPEEDEVLA